MLEIERESLATATDEQKGDAERVELDLLVEELPTFEFALMQQCADNGGV